jgi:hypothetical protein
MTYQEVDEVVHWGHGSVSRVLSDLHKAGLLCRLSEVRNRCKVYVLPEYVGGRETEPHGGRGGDRLTSEERRAYRTLMHRRTNDWGPCTFDPDDVWLLMDALDRLAPEPKSDG